jgi:dTDP-4-amino-4,6-dideoxygalactose transaminase
MKVPFIDLKAQHTPLREEFLAALDRKLDESSFVLGADVKKFEESFAEYIGVKNAISTGSGTAALQVALMALDVQPGDEILVPDMTFYATAEVVVLMGAKPVFVDIDPQTLCINPGVIKRSITRQTKGILPVHMYGHPADMDAISAIAKEHNLWIVEDCAHSPGSEYKDKKTGGFGDVNGFSFFPGKNIGALGEAGIVTTNDDTITRKCLEFRDHGSIVKFKHTSVGFNGRMDSIQAAFLSVKLPHLDKWNEARRRVVRLYNEKLSGLDITLPYESPDVKSVYHLYAIRTAKRDLVMKKMQEKGVGVNIHYPVPMHLHPGFAFLGGQKGDFPESEKFADETLSLPLFPEITDEQVDYVAGTLREIIEEM